MSTPENTAHPLTLAAHRLAEVATEVTVKISWFQSDAKVEADTAPQQAR